MQSFGLILCFSYRLHKHVTSNSAGGWAAQINDKNQWLQVKFGQRVEIRGVATQGRHNVYQWMTSYSLRYSSDGMVFHHYQTNTKQTVSLFQFSSFFQRSRKISFLWFVSFCLYLFVSVSVFSKLMQFEFYLVRCNYNHADIQLYLGGFPSLFGTMK